MWGSPQQVLRMDNGPEFISHALQQFCAPAGSESHTSRRAPHGIMGISNHSTNLLEARVVIGDFKELQQVGCVLGNGPHPCELSERRSPTNARRDVRGGGRGSRPLRLTLKRCSVNRRI